MRIAWDNAIQQMATALLQATFSQSAIDAEKGIIRGVKIMELGKVARFKGPDGKPKSVTIADAHIKRLMSFAGNRAVTSHLTHDWFSAQGKDNADTVEMEARVGAFKQFRKDDSGSLVADYYLKDGKHRGDILWGAEHNPEDNVVSVVFSYDLADPLCMPLDFRAADLVPVGAATTAMFSQNPNDTDMTKEEIVSLIKENSASKQDVTEAVTAALAKFNPSVTAKDIDDKVTAALAGYKPVMSDDEKKSVALLAKAELTKEIGTLGLVQSTQKAADEFESAVTAQLSAGAKDRPTAILRLAADKPEIYNAAVASGRI